MTAAWWAMIGVGVWIGASTIVVTALDRDLREGLIRALLAPVALLLLSVASTAARCPKIGRRVTPESLVAAVLDERMDNRTWAINWPGGALVLLRSRRLPDAPTDFHTRQEDQ